MSVIGAAELRDRQDGADGDERHEQRVLQQVLPLVLAREVDDDVDRVAHGGSFRVGSPRVCYAKGSPLRES